MNRERTMTAFYLETVLMVIIFVAVIAILSQVFGLSRSQSSQAEQLTNAVCLAQNTAEAVSAAEDPEQMLQLLDEGDNAQLTGDSEGAKLTAYYDMSMQPLTKEAAEKADGGSLRVEASWQPEEGRTGDFVTSRISVYEGMGKKPLYTLDTGVYVSGEGGAR